MQLFLPATFYSSLPGAPAGGMGHGDLVFFMTNAGFRYGFRPVWRAALAPFELWRGHAL